MNKNKISYLVISDIHLGHRKNKTSNIVNNLFTYFRDNSKIFTTLDIIFVAGDIFDRLLSPASDDYNTAINWLTMLARFCKHNKIKLRILEGTPSHDNQQARVLYTVLSNLEIELDYKYFNTLDIEHMEDLGLDILYIPDEWNNKAIDTYDEVMKLLKSKQLSKVDIAIMHGQFKYQLPILLESSHDENSYLNICKYYIHVGHIHTASSYGRILAQGSFDRITHGEEEDKGAMYVILYKNNDPEYFFIKNENSMVFNTYRYTGSEVMDIIKDLHSKIKSLPIDSHIRVIVNKEDMIANISKALNEKYKHVYNIKVEYKKENVEDEDEVISDIEEIETFTITSSNIEKLLLEELTKYELTTEELDICRSELKDIMDNI